MFDLMNPMLAYMVCTLLLGFFAGWIIWGFGASQKEKTLSSEVDFWRASVEEARAKRDLDHTRIETLEREKEAMKQRLAAKK